jgi:hypothetical protein
MPNGEWIDPNWLSDEFARLLTASGLPPIRFHGLRHDAATLALAAGVDLKVVQEMLRHASMRTTSDVCTSVLPEIAIAAAEAAAALVPRTHFEPSGLTPDSPRVLEQAHADDTAAGPEGTSTSDA